MAWMVGGNRHLKLIQRDTWDGAAAGWAMFAHAGFDGDNPDPAVARQGFVLYDPDQASVREGYALPFADVVDGELCAISSGVDAARSMMGRVDGMTDDLQKECAAMLGAVMAPDDMGMGAKMSATGRINLALTPSAGGEFDVIAITPGVGNGLSFPAGALEASLSHWNDIPVYVDHSMAISRSVKDLGGVFHDPRWDGGIRGRLRAAGPQGPLLDALAREWLADQAAGRPAPNVGLSADLLYHSSGTEVSEIVRVLSLDLVMDPARGGAILRALNSIQVQGGAMPQPIVVPSPGEVGGAVPPSPSSLGSAAATPPAVIAGVDPPASVSSGSDPAHAQLAMPNPADFMRAQCQILLDLALVAAADLPAASQQMIRSQFSGQVFAPDSLAQALRQQRELVASLRPSVVVGNGATLAQQAQPNGGMWPTGGQIQMWTGMDRLELAVRRDIFGGTLPAGSPQVERLLGLQHLYKVCTGDWAMDGGFYPERTSLAAITTTTMAGLVKNALNVVTLERWSDLANSGYMWWKDIVTEEDFSSVQDVDWVNVGGLANLPVVAEGETYDELAWGDQTQTTPFVTEGGILTLTWQTIDRDQTQKVRAIPRLLAISGMRSLSALVAAIFTDNAGTGPTMDFDSGALFQAAGARGNNLVTTTLSYDAWIACQQVMFKQAEINSSKRLGLRPRFLLVPVEKRELGLEIAGTRLATGVPQVPGSANYRFSSADLAPENVRTVPEWTDAYKWAAVADPAMYSSIGIGYRFGRVPQVALEVPDTGGSFTNRTTRYRVDFVVAVDVIDYRGVYKSNATT